MSIQQKALYLVKNTPVLYNLYFRSVGTCVSLARKIYRPDRKRILFVAFGGKKFDDSPKAVYEAMIRDDRFRDVDIVWGLNNPSAADLPRGRKVKTDTPAYYKAALTSGCWVTNSSVERGLDFKSDRQFCLNTWHGTAIKKIGADMRKDSAQFKIKKKKSATDVMLTQSDYDTRTMMGAMSFPQEKFAQIGYPRNDALVTATEEDRKRIREKLGIGEGKVAVLYAPTFREWDINADKTFSFVSPLDLEEWKRELGDSHVLIFRAHYEIARLTGVKSEKGIIEASGYPSLDELMIASDILVSDYSSIFFDYSLLHKPMLAFAYDYDKYADLRGVYFDIREELDNAASGSGLIGMIRNIDPEEQRRKAMKFQEKYVTEYGNASQRALDIIAKKLGLE